MLTRTPCTSTANARGSRSCSSSGDASVPYETIAASPDAFGVFTHRSTLSAVPEIPVIGFRTTRVMGAVEGQRPVRVAVQPAGLAQARRRPTSVPDRLLPDASAAVVPRVSPSRQ